MARVLLSNTDDWKLKFEEQDVRGRTAYDASGDAVGTVDDMIVDTDVRRVTSIRLDGGREFPARDIAIADGAVYLSRDVPEDVAETVTVYNDYGHVVEREGVGAAGAAGVAGYDAYVSDFQAHHNSTYADSARDYAAYEPAYRYGYESARHDTFRDRDYSEVESDLRSRYTERHPDRDYDADREAIRYGFTRARTS